MAFPGETWINSHRPPRGLADRLFGILILLHLLDLPPLRFNFLLLLLNLTLRLRIRILLILHLVADQE
ncbi:MAG TPA: hypothetical protein VHY56_01390, partial [Candidatus Binataceae bacterium]|nr:hypothetical protein [Candidatus Binataceae bacterium]